MQVNAIQNHSNPTFGINIIKDADYRAIYDHLKTLSGPQNADLFEKTIEEMDIGGSKDAINLVFFPMEVWDRKLAIFYSFFKKGDTQPWHNYYEMFVEDIKGMCDKIKDMCTAFANGEHFERNIQIHDKWYRACTVSRKPYNQKSHAFGNWSK